MTVLDDFELGKKKVEHKCPGCGHVWKVAARYVEWSKRGGYPLTCYACAMLNSAARHVETAERLRARAEEILGRRQAKSGKGKP